MVQFSVEERVDIVKFYIKTGSITGLIILRFYLWGALKGKAYANNPQTIDQLKRKHYKCDIEHLSSRITTCYSKHDDTGAAMSVEGTSSICYNR